MHRSGLRLKHGLKDMQLRSIFQVRRCGLHLEANLKGAVPTYLTSLQAYNSTKVLHFDDISAGFGGFASADNFTKCATLPLLVLVMKNGACLRRVLFYHFA